VGCGRGASDGPGGLGARDAQAGGVWRAKPKSPLTGAISVRPGENPQLTAAGGCRVRERGK
jgi:hypothetical protein